MVWMYGCMAFPIRFLYAQGRKAYNAGEMWTGALSGRENWTPIATGSLFPKNKDGMLLSCKHYTHLCMTST